MGNMGFDPHGFIWLVITAATVLMGALGLLIQGTVVLGIRFVLDLPADRPPWPYHLAVAVAGPLVPVLVGVLALFVTHGPALHSELLADDLDEYGLAMPILCVGCWAAVTLAIVVGRRLIAMGQVQGTVAP